MTTNEKVDRHIHEYEFRLRILVTNRCNKACSFCLNDFQDKHPQMDLDVELGKAIISAYTNVEDNPIITISGGEPGLYANLLELIEGTEGCIVKAVTNGALFRRPDWIRIKPLLSCVNYSIYHDTEIQWDEVGEKVHFQTVYTTGKELCDILKHVGGYPIKIFDNFLSPHRDYDNVIDTLSRTYPNITGRFTGQQENRGVGCMACDKKCVTLKGVWLFPDGAMTPCPQGKRAIPDNIIDYIRMAKLFHEKRGDR